jgi:phage terminase small subunit
LESNLTDKQERFCQEYLIDLNATQAAIRAGYSSNTAYAIGWENLRKPEIHARVKELQKDRLDKLQFSQEWVLLRLMQISDRSMQAEEVLKFDPEKQCMVGTGEYVFDGGSANRATELLGKHLGMFKDAPAAPPINLNFTNLNADELNQVLELQKKAGIE